MVIGDPPGDTHWRRNLDAVMDGKQLLAIGIARAHQYMCCHMSAGSRVTALTCPGLISDIKLALATAARTK